MKDDVMNILKYATGKEDRQTMLFSATFPKKLEVFTQGVIKSDFMVVNTIIENREESHALEHKLMVCPVEDMIAQLCCLLIQISQDPNHKVVVFLPTAKMTILFSKLFLPSYFPQLLTIHSRLSQSRRLSISNTYRSLSQGILFSSDISARGMDYPDVTHIIQFSSPLSTEQYIHRIGRTGRIGKTGIGILLMSDWENKCLADRIIPKLPAPLLPLEPAEFFALKSVKEKLVIHGRGLEEDIVEMGYLSMLGLARNFGLKKQDLTDYLVDLNKLFTLAMGRLERPTVIKSKANRFGMAKLPGFISYK